MAVQRAWLVLAILTWSQVAEAARILVVTPLPGKSHIILGDGVVRHLLEAGHEVTYITPTIRKNPPPNLHQVDISNNFNLYSSDEVFNIKSLMNKESVMDEMLVIHYMQMLHNETLQNPNVQKLMRDPSQQFDVIIVEWMFSEAYAGLAAVFNAPFIWLSTVEPHFMVLRLIDQAPNPAYTAAISSSSVVPFSFFERTEQLFYQLRGMAISTFVLEKFDKKIYESLVPIIMQRGLPVPDYSDLKYNASLMLGNSHVSMGEPLALPQNYKAVGGYHIDTTVKPLPEDLQKLMDNAKHGVIYFSMGSNLKSKDMPVELKRSLLKMFGGLKQTVLWKFEEALSDAPSNVHVLQWAPQPSILAHPNCVLFITHGGLLSTTESIHFAKPIIGVPVFGDQYVNVNRAVNKGFAVRVDLSYTMADELKVAIDEILTNPKYTNRVKELSVIYHDRPVPPGAELVHWVEHVARTRGAPHLRSPALHVPIYQKMYLDLLALVAGALLALKALIQTLICRQSVQKKQKKH